MGMLVSKDNENGELDDLVGMIDKLIEQGDGHLVINVDELSSGIKVNRYSTTDCGTGAKPSACCQPNEKSEDDDDDE